jgi:protoporphyrinogen/coproporphyrinogen III oxidase
VTSSALVVGAGLAGLTAAFRLQHAGLRVTVLDARSELADGAGRDVALAPLEPTLPESAPALHALACEIGLGKQLRRVALEELEVRAGAASHRVALHAARHCVGSDGPLGWLRLRRLRRLLRWYGPYLEPDRPELGERLDDRSVADWCRLYLGRRAAQGWQPLFATHYGIDARQASRLLALHLLDPLGTVRLGQPFGLAELRSALAARLADVRTGQRVLRVAPSGRVWLASGEELAADVTVLAVPAAEVRGCADDLYPAERTALDRIGSNARVQLVLRARIAPRANALCWVTSAPALSGVVDGSTLAGDRDGEERSVALLAHPRFADESRERTDAEIARRLLADAEPYVPGLGSSILDSRLWRRTVPSFDVGHYRAVARLRAEALAARERGRRWVQGGDDLVAPHAEGAVVAGTRAAEEALRLRAARS